MVLRLMVMNPLVQTVRNSPNTKIQADHNHRYVGWDLFFPMICKSFLKLVSCLPLDPLYKMPSWKKRAKAHSIFFFNNLKILIGLDERM